MYKAVYRESKGSSGEEKLFFRVRNVLEIILYYNFNNKNNKNVTKFFEIYFLYFHFCWGQFSSPCEISSPLGTRRNYVALSPKQHFTYLKLRKLRAHKNQSNFLGATFCFCS